MKSTMMKSVALLVGINDYDAKGKELTNPTNDVDEMEKALSDLGFSVTSKKNCTLSDIGVAIGEFQNLCNSYEVGLFYFSGHGFQDKGENYLCVKDTQIGSSEVMRNTAKRLEDVFNGMPESLKVKIFILDACRTKIKGIKGLSNSLCPVYAPQGSIVAFATSPNDYSYESDSPDGLSMYTECLLKHIKTRGITIEECFKRVRTTLFAKSQQQQLSWEHTSLIGDYSFNNGPLLPKGMLPQYSDEALADCSFIPDNSDAGKIVEGLRSHNWYTQNYAIDDLHKLSIKNVDPNTQFVLGRNILQSACGQSNKALTIFEDLKRHLIKWQMPNKSNHVLDGILFEIYFNRNGMIRNVGQMKISLFDKIMIFENDLEFAESFSFIREQLIPYSSMLFYIPGNNTDSLSIELNFKIFEGKYSEDYVLESVQLNGIEILEKNEYGNTSSRSYTETCELIKNYMAVPSHKVDFHTTEEFKNNAVIQIPYPLRLKTVSSDGTTGLNNEME